MKVPRLVLIAVLASLFLPALASAKDAAPPGNSAVDQYRESAPPTSPGSKKLSQSRERALAKEGRDGAALAAVLDKNGGVPSSGPSGGASSGSDTQSGRDAESDGDAPSDGAAPKGSGSGASSKSGPSGAEGSGSAGAGSASRAGPSPEKKTSTTNAAASSTVGPLPVWAMLIAAVVVVGIGLVVRRRPSA